MSDISTRTDAAPTTAGHLAVRLEDDHPADVPFLFERPEKHIGPAFVAALGWHIFAVLAIVFMGWYAPRATATGEAAADPMPLDRIVWLNVPGPGGGGGGGGNRMPEPPRKAELPGREKITVPVTKPLTAPVRPVEKPADPPPPAQELTIPARAMGSSSETLPGAIEGTSASTASLGPGTGGGAGTGTGTGIGPGTGSGLGPGYGGGFGGGAYQPGAGIDIPTVIREVKPQYTAEAMRAKIQGVVLLEAVVQTDGTVGDVRVIRSLDPVFGLDQEALKAARQWRFVPGRRQGQPVPVLVSIELTFTLR
ncbi:MAG: TonB family protein [Acidobacteria bacterium]|nr:TonB family protein [Acidobacteriota bacterium]